MKNKLFAVLATLALLVVGANLKAQSSATYTQGPTAVTCAAATAAPPGVKYFTQFQCHLNVYQNGVLAGSLSFTTTGGTADRFSYDVNGALVNSGYAPASVPITETGFTLPSDFTLNPVAPGTIAFTFSAPDANGVIHTGSVSAEWVNVLVRGNRGWYHPQLVAGSTTLTINN
jgi:hypothetical protein